MSESEQVPALKPPKNPQNTTQSLNGFLTLPLVKQAGLLAVIALTVAIAVMTVLWAQKPDMSPLYPELDNNSKSEVITQLTRLGIDYKLDSKSGFILVNTTEQQSIKIKLAAQGLPNASNAGFEILDKESGFGTSQFVESTRFLRGLQGELERTITNIDKIRNARVHLAIPKQSSFARKRKTPSASVLVDVHSGMALASDQVMAIRHLVAASIQGMEVDNVAVVDQNGRLLTSTGNDEIAAASKQIDYVNKIQDMYASRIVDLLEPIVGFGRVKSEVNALIDFTQYEETAEHFNPDESVIRSEKIQEEQNRTDAQGAIGIPGAQTNQPLPVNLVTPTPGEVEEGLEALSGLLNKKTSKVKNYELTKKVSRTINQTGTIQKLTVAVLVDDKVSYDEAGQETKTALTEEEIQKFESLIRNAIGINSDRGDTISVINASFASPEPIMEQPEIPIYQQDWFLVLFKQIIGGAIVLFIFIVIIKPWFQNLSQLPKAAVALDQEALEAEALQAVRRSNAVTSSNTEDLERLKIMASDDPKRVAQVVKNWLEDEG